MYKIQVILLSFFLFKKKNIFFCIKWFLLSSIKTTIDWNIPINAFPCQYHSSKSEYCVSWSAHGEFEDNDPSQISAHSAASLYTEWQIHDCPHSTQICPILGVPVDILEYVYFHLVLVTFFMFLAWRSWRRCDTGSSSPMREKVWTDIMSS